MFYLFTFFCFCAMPSHVKSMLGSWFYSFCWELCLRFFLYLRYAQVVGFVPHFQLQYISVFWHLLRCSCFLSASLLANMSKADSFCCPVIVLCNKHHACFYHCCTTGLWIRIFLCSHDPSLLRIAFYQNI